MKSKFALLLFLFSSFYIQSQTIKFVRSEIKKDQVLIFYQMPKVNERYIMHVQIWCENDGGKRFLLKSVSGDIGWDVRGGKYIYKAVWDPWKQVKKLKNAHFVFL